MNETLIACPECGHEFAISEALSAKARTDIESRLAQEYAARLKSAVRSAEEKARGAVTLELDDLRAQIAEQRRKAQEAERQELALRKRSRELEDKQKNLDLEIERRVDRERKAIETSVREQMDQTQGLKLKEKEQTIADLRRALEDATRKSQQGSQERQGEALELDVEEVLRTHFPEDEIRPVPRGVRGGDLLQDVRNMSGESCGLILWESKNTVRFQPAWIDKLKQDQRSSGAPIAVIVSVALPDGVREFGLIDGVWVVSRRACTALATALRQQLIQVAYARAASKGKGKKMELLYAYLSGDEFRHRVEALVEAFTAMQAQVDKERRAMERMWCEREKQIERIATGTAGMYGDLRGLIGAGMPEVRMLSLEVGDVGEGDTGQ